MAIFDKKIAYKKKFFSTYCQNKKCFPYTPLTSCQKSKKSDKRNFALKFSLGQILKNDKK